jgi:single-strand DNA-binding protein
MSLNQCNFIGRLGNDPKYNKTSNGTSAMSFSIAVNERRSSGDHTEWVRVEAYGKIVDALSWLKKGTHVCVVGKLRERKYEKDGQEKSITSIYADNIQVLSPKGDGQAAPSEPATPEVFVSHRRVSQPSPVAPQLGFGPSEDDDIPF